MGGIGCKLQAHPGNPAIGVFANLHRAPRFPHKLSAGSTTPNPQLPGYVPTVKIARLYQPRNPLFWTMVALNVLSALLAWITHNYTLGMLGSVLVTGFAFGNAVLGTALAWRLVNS